MGFCRWREWPRIISRPKAMEDASPVHRRGKRHTYIVTKRMFTRHNKECCSRPRSGNVSFDGEKGKAALRLMPSRVILSHSVGKTVRDLASDVGERTQSCEDREENGSVGTAGQRRRRNCLIWNFSAPWV